MDQHAKAEAAFQNGDFDTASSIMLAEVKTDPTNIDRVSPGKRALTDEPCSVAPQSMTRPLRYEAARGVNRVLSRGDGTAGRNEVVEGLLAVLPPNL